MSLTPEDQARFDAIWEEHLRRQAARDAARPEPRPNRLTDATIAALDASIERLRRQDAALEAKPLPPKRGRVPFTRASPVTVKDEDGNELGTHPAYNPYQQARVVKGRPPNLPRGEQ